MRLVVACCVLVALLPARPAFAQKDPLAQGTTVAGPTAGGWTLRAARDGERLCLGLVDSGGEIEERECGVPPADPDAPLVLSGPVVGGAVARAVSSAEVQDQTTARRLLTLSEHAGFPGQRFFLDEPPAKSEPWLLVSHAGADTATAFRDPPPRAGPKTVARGTGVHVTIALEQGLLPTPADATHVVTQPCVTVVRDGFGSGNCQDVEPLWRAPLEYVLSAGGVELNGRPLRYPRAELAGLAAPAVARLTARLGNGRRVRIPLHKAAAIGETRWFEFSPPPRLALASLVARDAAGRELFSEGFWLPPQGTTRFDSYVIPGRPDPPIPPGARPVYTPPGGAPLSLVDGQESLCLGVEGGAGGCGPVPVAAPQLLLASGLEPDGGTIAAVTPPDTRVLRFQPDFPAGAAPVEVATQPVGDYGGRWQDLRVAGTHLPEQSNVDVTVIRDDGSEFELGSVQLYRTDVLDPRPALRLHPRGGEAVTIGTERDGDCYDVMFRGRSVYDGCRAVLELIATCRPRAEVIVTSDRATIRTAERTRLRAHRLNLGQGQHAFAYAVPAHEHVRSARIGRERIRLGRVPSASEQCGFALSHEGF